MYPVHPSVCPSQDSPPHRPWSRKMMTWDRGKRTGTVRVLADSRNARKTVNRNYRGLAAQKVHANTFVYALIPVERPHTILGGATFLSHYSILPRVDL